MDPTNTVYHNRAPDFSSETILHSLLGRVQSDKQRGFIINYKQIFSVFYCHDIDKLNHYLRLFDSTFFLNIYIFWREMNDVSLS